MKLNIAFAVAVVFAVLAVAIFSATALHVEFPVFHSSQNSTFVNINSDVGAADSRFMWNNDSLALVAQAFVLFAAAAATLGLLKGGDDENA